MKETKLARCASLLIIFLLILELTLFIFPTLANGESTSAVRPPEGVGPYSVSYINVDIPKTGGGTLPVSVYYPSVTSGGGEPNKTAAPYPTLLFSLGFMSGIDNYRNLAFNVTSWGFVFTLAGSDPGTMNPERASDVIDALNWVDEQNDNSSFILHQMIDESKFGVMGHSLGGEAAIIVSNSDPRPKVLVPIAPFTVSPGSTAYIHVPILILVGSADTVTPPVAMAYPLYDNGNVPKFCLTIIGENHFGIVFSCTKYVISFLEFYLYGDQDYATYLYGREAQQEILGGKISLRYDLRKTIEHRVLFKGCTYSVSVYTDSTFLTFSYNESLNEMNFTLEGPPYTVGTTNVSIPAQLVGGYDIEAYLDGEPYPFALSNSSVSWFIYLAYNHSVHQLTIDFVDQVPPVLYITSPDAGSATRSPNVTVAWTSEDVASGLDYFEVKIDGEAWIRVENAMSYTFRELVDGDHVARVKAFDKVGNSEEVSVDFKVDTTPPSVSIISPAACSVISSPNVAVSWSGSDSVSGIERYEVKLDDGSWINLETNTHYVFVGLADGNHTVHVKAVDKAGNPSEILIGFTVETGSNPSLLWTQFWFWATVAVGVGFSVIVIFYIERRKHVTR